MNYLRKLVVGICFALLLSACAATTVTSGLTPAQAAQALANQATHQYQECLIYKASQPIIAQKVKTLPIASATALYDASVVSSKYCSTVFTNSASQANALASALTTIALQAGINYSIQPGAIK